MRHLTIDEEQLLVQIIDRVPPAKSAAIDRLTLMVPDDEAAAQLKVDLLRRLVAMNDRQYAVNCVYALENKIEAGDSRG